jgi:hypothetical protein
MKCKQVQERLLATSGHRQLPAEVSDHVEGCASCRRWHDGLREIDAGIRQLPVPDSQASKAALIARFLSPTAAPSRPMWKKVRITWSRGIAAAAAAIILALGFAGVFNREHRYKVPAGHDALLARVMERNIELASADSVNKRVKVLADLAGDLDEQTRAWAHVARGDDLNSLAEMFDSIVRSDKGLLVRADELPAGDRKSVLEPIAKSLLVISQRADEDSQRVPPPAIGALRKIAATARDARLAIDHMLMAADGKVRDENLVQDAPPPSGKVKS